MSKPSKVEKLVFQMLTENTGTHFLDSGGASGRMWQRNQALKLADFRKRPECTLELSMYNGSIEANVTIDVFHFLTKNLTADELCEQFNEQEVPDWQSDQFYGVSADGEQFLLQHFKPVGDSFNTYSWCANYSQVMQGCELEHLETGEKYYLLQIHGGADVRGGYTDAKLFKLDNCADYLLREDCLFDGIDYLGEFITNEGRSATDDDWKALAKKYKLKEGKTVTIEGSLCE